MIKAILFDLDDTLLDSRMERFMRAYFADIARHAAPLLDEKQFVTVLLAATRAMMSDVDPAKTNRAVFWEAFTELTGLDAAATEEHFTTYYENGFDQLRPVTRPRRAARSLITWALANVPHVAIATNPVFPRRAITHRLAWADVPVTEFEYDLVTSYENMHATKPHPAYYAEIIARLGVAPEEALMVGDSWVNDIAPASEVGLYTHWIALEEARRPDQTAVTAVGPLETLAERLREGWLEQLV